MIQPWLAPSYIYICITFKVWCINANITSIPQDGGCPASVSSGVGAGACQTQQLDEPVTARFRLEVDICELEESKSSRCAPVHRDRHVFKLRRDRVKQLTIRVQALQSTCQFRVEKFVHFTRYLREFRVVVDGGGGGHCTITIMVVIRVALPLFCSWEFIQIYNLEDVVYIILLNSLA